jgi:hypothetical protein
LVFTLVELNLRTSGAFVGLKSGPMLECRSEEIQLSLIGSISVKFFCGCDCGSVGVIVDCGVLVQQSSVWQSECSNGSLGIDIVEALAGQRTSLDEVGFNINLDE